MTGERVALPPHDERLCGTGAIKACRCPCITCMGARLAVGMPAEPPPAPDSPA